MNQVTPLQPKSLDWLLDSADPNVRYLALRDLLDAPDDDPELVTARAIAYTQGPIAAILDAMDEQGYWVRPGPGYTAKYRSGVWSLIALSQIGARIAEDTRIEKACAYLLDHALTDAGQFSYSGAPSGTIDCLQGNLCAALLDLGCEDPRLATAFEWMARSVTGEGEQASLYFEKGNTGPLFACSYNGRLSCAWGGVKIMLAFSKLPPERRTPSIQAAIQAGIDFLFSVDPALATYPTRKDPKPNRNWWKFGFPVFYITDLLQNVEALVTLGYGLDPRLSHALDLIRDKQDEQGRWSLEHDYAGRTWGSYGSLGRPNKWVTLRALRVLKMVSEG